MSYPNPEPQFQRWLAAARKGDMDSLGRLFDHFRQQLLRVAHARLSDILQPKIEPLDLVQDTFVEAQIGLLRFLGLTEEATFRWLKRILRNNILDLTRRYNSAKRAITSEQQLNTTWLNVLVDQDPTPRTQVANRELSKQFKIAMELVPREYWEVLYLREVDNLRFAEIAVKLKKPTADAARKAYDRAFKILHAQLARFAGSGGA
jgi:RNA polymerase sigma-70 factor, ECF subfamily